MKKSLAINNISIIEISLMFLWQYSPRAVLFKFPQTSLNRINLFDTLKPRFKDLEAIDSTIIDRLWFARKTELTTTKDFLNMNNLDENLIDSLEIFLETYDAYKQTNNILDSIDILISFKELLKDKIIVDEILYNYEFTIEDIENPNIPLIKSVIDKLTVN